MLLLFVCMVVLKFMFLISVPFCGTLLAPICKQRVIFSVFQSFSVLSRNSQQNKFSQVIVSSKKRHC